MSYPNMYLEENLPRTLCQGDIFFRFDDVTLPENPRWLESPYMVLTYSCDLAQPKDISYLTVSPVHKLFHLLEKYLEKNKDRKPENIKSNVFSQMFETANYKLPNLFFLSPTNELGNIPLYSDLTRIFSIRIESIPEILKNRIKCLKSPWREKLGFKLGHIYNRVAIDDEDEVKKDTIKQFIFEDNKELVEKFLSLNEV